MRLPSLNLLIGIVLGGLLTQFAHADAYPRQPPDQGNRRSLGTDA
jgi:hypothetical protein